MLKWPQHSSQTSRKKRSISRKVESWLVSKYIQKGPHCACIKYAFPSCASFSDSFLRSAQLCRCFVIALPENAFLQYLHIPSDFILLPPHAPPCICYNSLAPLESSTDKFPRDSRLTTLG